VLINYVAPDLMGFTSEVTIKSSRIMWEKSIPKRLSRWAAFIPAIQNVQREWKSVCAWIRMISFIAAQWLYPQ